MDSSAPRQGDGGTGQVPVTVTGGPWTAPAAEQPHLRAGDRRQDLVPGRRRQRPARQRQLHVARRAAPGHAARPRLWTSHPPSNSRARSSRASVWCWAATEKGGSGSATRAGRRSPGTRGIRRRARLGIRRHRAGHGSGIRSPGRLSAGGGTRVAARPGCHAAAADTAPIQGGTDTDWVKVGCSRSTTCAASATAACRLGRAARGALARRRKPRLGPAQVPV